MDATKRLPLDTREFYSTISERYYEETFGEVRSTRSFGRYMRTQAVLRMVDRYVPPGGLIADIGCGPAQYVEPLLQRGYTYRGIDISEDMYRAVAARLGANPKASFSVGSIERIPLPDAIADGVLVVGVIEYIESNEPAFQELHRITKPGGIVIVTFPNALNPWHAVRTLARPVVAPVLRAIAPNSRIARTVFVSDIPYRVFRARQLIRYAEQVGFRVRDTYCHGFDLYPKDHQLGQDQVEAKKGRELFWCGLLPGLGGNYILCLEKC